MVENIKIIKAKKTHIRAENVIRRISKWQKITLPDSLRIGLQRFLQLSSQVLLESLFPSWSMASFGTKGLGLTTRGLLSTGEFKYDFVIESKIDLLFDSKKDCTMKQGNPCTK